MCYVSFLLEGFRFPELVPSNTLLTAFDGRSFHSHGILLDFEIKLEGKVVSVEVEVIDVPLDFNLLLGRSWTYAMCVIPSVVLRAVVFHMKESWLLFTNSILLKGVVWK